MLVFRIGRTKTLSLRIDHTLSTRLISLVISGVAISSLFIVDLTVSKLSKRPKGITDVT